MTAAAAAFGAAAVGFGAGAAVTHFVVPKVTGRSAEQAEEAAQEAYRDVAAYLLADVRCAARPPAACDTGGDGECTALGDGRVCAATRPPTAESATTRVEAQLAAVAPELLAPACAGLTR